jgi:hypothetical protein
MRFYQDRNGAERARAGGGGADRAQLDERRFLILSHARIWWRVSGFAEYMVSTEVRTLVSNPRTCR